MREDSHPRRRNRVKPLSTDHLTTGSMASALDWTSVGPQMISLPVLLSKATVAAHEKRRGSGWLQRFVTVWRTG